jgi:signal peptidase II
VRRRSPLVLPLVLLAVVVVAADQATKTWALSALTEGERTPLLGDLLGLTLVFNPGAALSIGTGMTWILTLAAVAVTVVVLRVSSRLGSRAWTLALGLLLGGAVGNLIDRIFREPGVGRGEVVDFIAYADWFVGNVADIAIVAAAGLMILLGARGIALDGTRHVDGQTDGTGADTAPADEADAPGSTPATGEDADGAPADDEIAERR